MKIIQGSSKFRFDAGEIAFNSHYNFKLAFLCQTCGYEYFSIEGKIAQDVDYIIAIPKCCNCEKATPKKKSKK